MRHIARGVYGSFVDLFVSSFSRSQNAQFLRFVLNAFESGDWKKLAQCFIKAAGMGEKKVSGYLSNYRFKITLTRQYISHVSGAPRNGFEEYGIMG